MCFIPFSPLSTCLFHKLLPQIPLKMCANSFHFQIDQLDSDDPTFQDFLQGTSQDLDINQESTHVDDDDDNVDNEVQFNEPLSTINPAPAKNHNQHNPHNPDLNKDENFPIWEKQTIAEMNRFRQTITSMREQLNMQEAGLSSMEEDYRERKERYHAFLNREDNDLSGIGSTGRRKNGVVDYDNDKFVWDASLKDNMTKVFGIKAFRLCQRGVCNANMDGRDIVVVMPTGGGKSLTYQLPAIMTTGVTLVLSPLISLITDQIMHLRNAGVEAVKITGSTPKSDQDNINARLGSMAAGAAAAGRDSNEKEIKLVYCTPEKIAKSKRFVALLQRLADAMKLARIVIDEAHCVSQLGHDFRPDYQKLHILRQLFPNVPIMALSATCPPLVLKDLLKVLRLGEIVPADNVPKSKNNPPNTVYFTSPLYRPNLCYQVLPKAAEGNKVYEEITAWILEKHREDSGIVYCLSKKDTEKVATELTKRGGIRTGVYHSERSDSEKEKLHWNWQKGVVKVVCATIAFGLGIDKGDVRFVIHHSLSKSLDGYYQESGRAGRDGKDSDCVIYYRPQDASTLSSMAMADKDGNTKLYAMLLFVQDLEQCRKIQFANYFSHTSNLSLTSWSTSSVSAHTPCGHCDNCTRPADSFEVKDVTVEAWQLLKIIQEVVRGGGNATLAKTAELARRTGGAGAGGGHGRKRGKKSSGGGKESVIMDLDAVCGGKVLLKKEDIETLLIELLLQRYLKEQYYSTAYSTVVYIQPGERSAMLTRFSNKEALATLSESMRLSCSFRITKKNPKGKSAETSSKKAKEKTGATAAASTLNLDDELEDSDVPEFCSGIDNHHNDDDNEHSIRKFNSTTTAAGKQKATSSMSLQKNIRAQQASKPTIISDDEGDVDGAFKDTGGNRFIDVGLNHESSDVDDWMDIVTTKPPPRKRRKIERGELSQEIDVIELSSDES
ncbi:ATP-dependent DNA helicase [Lentinula aciculospora]|uniref:ATP-dependent DNA helicase n=1 Tax=Lentinula aciculospora TaxID=153920 RepID=A0A9W9DEJ7_9AGAR|nr:ATP-dependent DNA helicase [Lentinula aciculospora]